MDALSTPVLPKPQVAPVKRPVLREASISDYEQIAAVQARNGLRPKPREEWIQIWAENPAFRQGWPMGWVLENARSEIVGSITNLPINYRFQGARVVAATACGWSVDVEYRRFSMMLMDQFVKQPVDLLLATTIGPSSEPAMPLFQFTRVPRGEWHRTRFWITQYRGFSHVALGRYSPTIRTVLRYPLAGLLYCHGMLGAFRSHGSHGTELEWRTDFDKGFEDHWQDLRRENHSVVFAERSRAELNWRFQRKLARNEAWVIGAYRGSSLVAYAIFDRWDNEAIGLKRVRLVDVQALRSSEPAIRQIFEAMLWRCREEGVHVLELRGCPLDRNYPRPGAPYARRLPCWTYYYRASGFLAEALRHPSAWAPSCFDGDTSL